MVHLLEQCTTFDVVPSYKAAQSVGRMWVWKLTTKARQDSTALQWAVNQCGNQGAECGTAHHIIAQATAMQTMVLT